MSLYNMLFGVNPLSGVYLSMVGLSTTEVGRFRDAFLNKHGDPSKSEFDSSNFCGYSVAVYTRNGGNNRGHYADDKVAGPDCGCSGCIATYVLPSKPNYMSDENDDFDSTYATFHFQVPECFNGLLDVLETDNPDNKLRLIALEYAIRAIDLDRPEVQKTKPYLEATLAQIAEMKAKENGS